MNELKKFQEFALNEDEQKNLKGAKATFWRCNGANGGMQTFTMGGDYIGEGLAYLNSSGGGTCREITY